MKLAFLLRPAYYHHRLTIVILLVLFALYFPIRSLMQQKDREPLPYYTRRTSCPVSHDEDDVDIVIYIPSCIPWTQRRRQVLRKMRSELQGAHLYFIFGTRQGKSLEQEVDGLQAARTEASFEEIDSPVRYLFTECRDYGDEFDNPNGTSATTCKVYEALRYIAHAYADRPPRFVWRGADDSYLDLGVFRQHVMPGLQTCRLFLGGLRFPLPNTHEDLSLFDRQPNLYALYGLKKFGKYMQGMGFCMSWDVARFIGSSSIPPRLTWCEDVMVGQWLLFYDVDFVDIQSATPNVRMWENAWDINDIKQHPDALALVAHKMTTGQWLALARRPAGDISASYLLVQ